MWRLACQVLGLPRIGLHVEQLLDLVAVIHDVLVPVRADHAAGLGDFGKDELVARAVFAFKERPEAAAAHVWRRGDAGVVADRGHDVHA